MCGEGSGHGHIRNRITIGDGDTPELHYFWGKTYD